MISAFGVDHGEGDSHSFSKERDRKKGAKTGAAVGAGVGAAAVAPVAVIADAAGQGLYGTRKQNRKFFHSKKENASRAFRIKHAAGYHGGRAAMYGQVLGTGAVAGGALGAGAGAAIGRKKK